MKSFFLITMAFFIVSANIIGFISYIKKKNLYFTAFIILLLAFFFGAIGSLLALFIIRDAFAIFYGLKLGYFLIINSMIFFIIAISVSLVRKYRNRKM
ncbi:3-isopropylmalate dehydrogenase [Rummeliibacillus sp. SL167]|uniref:3-isopropylmalate dehydrogenase n=1 Tax=Rummeliibacillus sp. SL167 TaxID=2579792 RepID=UPI0011B60CC5|nr:3-isopropylmalate dehydrogenase [Rummeliibacillus sp. SL167]